MKNHLSTWFRLFYKGVIPGMEKEKHVVGLIIKKILIHFSVLIILRMIYEVCKAGVYPTLSTYLSIFLVLTDGKNIVNMFLT